MAEVAAAADLAALAADLSLASGTGIDTAAQQVIRQTAERVQKEAQSLVPVRSGRLRDSITIRYSGPLSAEIGPHTPYAGYVEYGTGTRGEFPGPMYEIKPRNPGGVLVFKVQGKTVFAKRVRHPGMVARPYMRPAIANVLGQETAKLLADTGALAITKGPNA